MNRVTECHISALQGQAHSLYLVWVPSTEVSDLSRGFVLSKPP